MRYREFKVLLEEEGQPGYYTIGDSHAEGVAKGAGRPWINAGVGGEQANSSRVIAKVSQVTPGSVVVVAAGANDTANSYKSANKDPKRVIPPATIASRVAALVNRVKAQKPSKIILLLFPNGTARTLGMQQWYNGDYQDQVRKAIVSSVSVDEIIDQNDYPISNDNIHLQWGAYGQIGKEIVRKYPLRKETTKQSGQQIAQPASATKEVESGLAVPTGRRGVEVRDIQLVLLALGYPLPKHGADGIRGPETKAAVKAFQEANGLTVDGDPGPETVAALNKIMAAKNIKITKSTPADVKSGPIGADQSQDVGDVISDDDPLVEKGRKSAERYLGREMSDEEWTALLKVTAAEEADYEAMAWVMAAILNRVNRGTWGGSVISVVSAPYQFEPVTGASGREKRLSSLPIPRGRKLKAILDGAVRVLPSVPKNIVNFTSNIDAAYKGRDSIRYKRQLLAKGGEVVGNTVFATA